MSNLFVPLTSSNVRTIHPRVISSRPQLLVLGRGREDAAKAEKIKAITEYNWEVSKADRTVRKVVLQAIIYGSGIFKVFWRTDKRVVSVPSGIDKNKRLTYKKELRTDYDDNDLAAVDTHGGFFPDPLCGDDITRGRFHVQRFLMTKEQAFATYNVEPELAHCCGTGDITRYDQVRLNQSTRYSKSKTEVGGGGKSTTASQSQVIEVLEYWERDCLAIIFGDTIVRVTPNPYRHKQFPFIKLDYEELPFEFWANGVPQQLEQVQEGLNSTRNQRIDNVTLSIHKMFIIDPTGFLDEADLVPRPFGTIRTPNPQSVVPLEYGDIKSSAYLEDDKYMEAGKMATGIDDYSRGLQGSASTSATAVTLQKESTLERVKLFVENLESSYSDIMRLWLENDKQFLKNKKIERIIGNDPDAPKEVINALDRPFRTRKGALFDYPIIEKDDLMGQFDFIIASLSTLAASKELKRKNNVEILDKAIQGGQNDLDMPELWSKVFEDMDWEPTRFLKKAQAAMPQGGNAVPPNPADVLLGGNPGQMKAANNPLTPGQNSGNLLGSALAT